MLELTKANVKQKGAVGYLLGSNKKRMGSLGVSTKKEKILAKT